MSTGQFPRTRKSAQQVYGDLREAGRSASDTFKQFVMKPKRRKKATAS